MAKKMIANTAESSLNGMAQFGDSPFFEFTIRGLDVEDSNRLRDSSMHAARGVLRAIVALSLSEDAKVNEPPVLGMRETIAAAELLLDIACATFTPASGAGGRTGN